MNGSTVTGSKAAITAVAMAAALMAFIDITIVNVALNDIRASFGTPIDQIGWVSTGYMMANIVVIPMTGWLQRRFGIRRYFSVSILIFTAASALCGLAWDLPSLVLFRALQGVGGGAIIPTAQMILFSRYPKKEQGMAGALFGLGAVTGPLLGPTIGGYLIDWSSWHWVFLVNVPIGIIAAIAATRVIEEPGFRPSKAPIDVFGIALLTVGMASLQYVLEEGNREGWFESTTITVLAGVSATALVTFFVHERETPYPVVDLSSFKNRTYAAGTGINLVVGLALFSGNFLFSLYAGSVMHYAALDIGKIFLVTGGVQLVLMPLIGRFGGRVDGRYLIVFGLTGITASLWLNAHLTAQAGFWDMAWPLFVRTVSLGFVFIPLSVIALGDVPAAQRGNATGLFNLTRELGGSIGTAWMGLIVDRGSAIHGSYLRESVYANNPLVQENIGAIANGVGASTFTRELVPEAVLDMKVRLQALVLSFNDGFRDAAGLFIAAFVLVFLLKKARPGSSAASAH